MEPVDILKKRDLLSYTDMIDQIERGIGRVFYCGMDGIVTIIDDYYACIAPFDSDVRPFVELLPKSVELVTVHRENLRGMMREYGYRMSNPCSTYVYVKDEDVPVREQDIRVLDASYAEVMDSHYHLFSDIDYIKERLESGVVRGIFVDGELAGFMAEHSEGAMGMLEIFPEYQRRGLAYDLEGAYINEHRNHHRMYCNVVNGNDASECLQQKLGLVKAGICSDWYSLY